MHENIKYCHPIRSGVSYAPAGVLGDLGIATHTGVPRAENSHFDFGFYVRIMRPMLNEIASALKFRFRLLGARSHRTGIPKSRNLACVSNGTTLLQKVIKLHAAKFISNCSESNATEPVDRRADKLHP